MIVSLLIQAFASLIGPLVVRLETGRTLLPCLALFQTSQASVDELFDPAHSCHSTIGVVGHAMLFRLC